MQDSRVRRPGGGQCDEGNDSGELTGVTERQMPGPSARTGRPGRKKGKLAR
jgi:hypothetical protein